MLPRLHISLVLFSGKLFLKMNLSLISCVMVPDEGDLPQLLPTKKCPWGLKVLFLKLTSVFLTWQGTLRSLLFKTQLEHWREECEHLCFEMVVIFQRVSCFVFPLKSLRKNCQTDSKTHSLKFNLPFDLCLPLRFSVTPLRSHVVSEL